MASLCPLIVELIKLMFETFLPKMHCSRDTWGTYLYNNNNNNNNSNNNNNNKNNNNNVPCLWYIVLLLHF